jgi:hypothetical protein
VNKFARLLRVFIEEEVEILSDSQQEARNSNIIVDVSYIKSKDLFHMRSTTRETDKLHVCLLMQMCMQNFLVVFSIYLKIIQRIFTKCSINQ